MSAAGQGASFDELHAKMKWPLKYVTGDPTKRITCRRLLRELAADGYIAETDGRWRIVDDEMADVFRYLSISLRVD